MSLQILKKRIQNTKNIEQITKVIEMIANSKLKSSQSAFYASKNMEESFIKSTKDFSNIRMKNREEDLYILFGSDSGFCGSINSTCFKRFNSLELKKEDNVIIFGKKLENIINFQKNHSNQMAKILQIKENQDYVNSENLNSEDFAEVLNKITRIIFDKNSKIKKVFILYFDFINMMSKNFKALEIANLSDSKSHKTEFYSSEDDVDLFKLKIKLSINRAFRSNLASIISSRAISMNGAYKNAEKMYKELKVKYNKLRQEKINKEMLDMFVSML